MTKCRVVHDVREALLGWQAAKSGLIDDLKDRHDFHWPSA